MPPSFNQTNVELKQNFSKFINPPSGPFNQTNVELKPWREKKQVMKDNAFNQTNVELKHLYIGEIRA